MRIGHAQPAKYQFFDRANVLSSLRRTLTGVAPHADTVQASLTLASTERGKIEHAFMETRRATAATTAGEVRLEYQLFVGGIVYRSRIRHYDNTVNAVRSVYDFEHGYIAPSYTLRWVTADASTGGTNDYQMEMMLYTFTA